jgi:hypothetical protein
MTKTPPSEPNKPHKRFRSHTLDYGEELTPENLKNAFESLQTTKNSHDFEISQDVWVVDCYVEGSTDWYLEISFQESDESFKDRKEAYEKELLEYSKKLAEYTREKINLEKSRKIDTIKDKIKGIEAYLEEKRTTHERQIKNLQEDLEEFQEDLRNLVEETPDTNEKSNI